MSNINMNLVEVGRGDVDWACSTNGRKSNAYRLLVEKPEGKRPIGRPRNRWVDNIKMDLVEVGWAVWTGLVYLRIGTGGELL
jgi:hypothetical protein